MSFTFVDSNPIIMSASSAIAKSPKSGALKATYYPALTGIRAVAAYLVYFFHFNPFHHATTGKATLPEAIVEEWHIGVTIFFVLSGFLIAARYAERITPSLAWAKQYMLNRFARIYPLYFLLTVITFCAIPIRHVYAWYEWAIDTTVVDKIALLLTNFTLTRAFFKYFVTTGVPTAWSLTVEECFYISAPFLLLALRKRPKLLPVFAVGLLSVGALLTFVSTQLHAYGGFMRPFSFVLTYTYFGRCMEFLLGIGLALWVKKRGDGPAMRGTTILSLLLIAVCMAVMVLNSWGYQKTEAWPTPFTNTVINNLFLPVGVIVLFHGLIHEQTWFRRLLETPLFDLLGKSSYAFYLIHFGLFSDLLISVVGHNVFLLFLIFNVAAIALYKFVEHPMHSIIKSRFHFGAEKQPLVPVATEVV